MGFKPQRGKFTRAEQAKKGRLVNRFKPQRGKFTRYAPHDTHF